MAFKKPSIKKTIVDISQARIYLRSVKKFGKTTLFRDIILEKYGSPEYGMLLGIGKELGYELLDEINPTQIESWEDLIEMKKWLLSDDEEAKKIRIIGFDTVDELMPLAEDYVCRQWARKKKEPCDSINKAYGGFGAGQKAVCELVKEFFFDIHKAGVGVFAIAHTKLRNVVDKGSEGTEGYQVLTSNLTTQYESVFGDIFDIVLTGTIDRGITDGIATKDERQLYFRGNTKIDAGGRFAPGSVPDYMVFEGDDVAKKFISIVEEGMRKSLKKPLDNKEFEKYKEESKKEKQAAAEALKAEVAEKDKYREYAEAHGTDFVKTNYKIEGIKEIVSEVLKDKGITDIYSFEVDDFVKIIKFGVEELGLKMEE